MHTATWVTLQCHAVGKPSLKDSILHDSIHRTFQKDKNVGTENRSVNSYQSLVSCQSLRTGKVLTTKGAALKEICRVLEMICILFEVAVMRISTWIKMHRQYIPIKVTLIIHKENMLGKAKNSKSP